MVIRSAFHATMYSLAVSAPFNLFVVIIVVINTVQMIMLTSPYARALYGLYTAVIYTYHSHPPMRLMVVVVVVVVVVVAIDE